jgi:hypothetical protein
MSFLRLLQLVLWIFPVVVQLLIAATMVRRGLLGRFSCFFIFSLYAPARDVLLFLLQGHATAYFLIYWGGEGVSIALELLVLWQTARLLVDPYPELSACAAKIFWLSMVVCTFLAAVTFDTSMAGAGSPAIELVLLAERSARVFEVSLLVVMLAFLFRLGLTSNRYATGILLGCGIAGLQLILFELRARLHAISDDTFIWIAPAIYDCAVLLWAVYLLPSPSETLADLPPATDLARWHQTVKEYLARP